MLDAHGLFISDKDLQVEMEILLSYCHLVIFGYFECLCCGTQRNGVNAVQQHMKDKGHCKIDVVEGSEFRDFFDPELGHEDTEDDAVTSAQQSTPVFGQPDDTTLRLSSGKLLTHRSVGKPRPQRPKHPDKDIPGSQSGAIDPPLSPSPPNPANALDPSTPPALTTNRVERRAAAFTNQLMHLRVSDRSSLIHLPTSQQRALLAIQKKQMDRARKAERRMQIRVESMGNQTLMKHFVMDVPGPQNG